MINNSTKPLREIFSKKSTPITFSRPRLPVTALAELAAVFRSGRLSPGPRVRDFERAWAALHGSRHGIFVNSGTDALRLALLSLKERYRWPDGAWVAVPAVTFVATVNIILQAGLEPFFVDVNEDDYLINPDNLVWRLKTSRAKVVAVMPVHLFGQSCGDGIFEMAKKHKWRVVEDSCETVLNKRRGDISCHSTYMAHHVTTGVGGIALTDDEKLNLLMRSYANHGRDVAYLPGYNTPKLTKDLLRRRFSFDRAGYSCRSTEFEAVLGLSQLPDLEAQVAGRRETAQRLNEVLLDFEELVLPVAVHDHSWMMFPVVLKEKSKIDKYDLCLALERSGIETRDMMPVTNQKCYQHLVKERDFPVARWLNRYGFYIPCHPGQDTERVRAAFEGYLRKRRTHVRLKAL